MTMQRRDGKGTDFTNWIRTPEALSSDRGYIATDVDLVWENYIKKEYMLLEEKRKLAEPTFCQWQQIKRRHKVNKGRPEYRGYHIIQFENYGPLDGRIWIDRKEVSLDNLIHFLKFSDDVDVDSIEKIHNRKAPSQILLEEEQSRKEDDCLFYEEDVFPDTSKWSEG